MLKRLPITGVVVTGLALIAVALTAVPQAAQAPADQAQTVLSEMRKALGGDKAEAVKSLSAEGTYRRTMGEREMSGDLELYFLLPDRYQRVEQFQLPTGMPGPRLLTTFNGAAGGWMDSQGGSGGGGFMVRMQGPDGPGGQGGRGGPGGPGGPGGRNMDPTPRIRADYYRAVLGILPVAQTVSSLTFTHAGQADSNDGTADALDVKGEGFAARLFVDTRTHLPLMLVFTAQQMRGRTFERKPGETPEDIRKRFEADRERLAAEPPLMVENTVYFADHKKVDGVVLPHRLTRAIDGKTVEEMEIKKYKINPEIDPQQFQKKGS